MITLPKTTITAWNMNWLLIKSLEHIPNPRSSSELFVSRQWTSNLVWSEEIEYLQDAMRNNACTATEICTIAITGAIFLLKWNEVIFSQSESINSLHTNEWLLTWFLCLLHTIHKKQPPIESAGIRNSIRLGLGPRTSQTAYQPHIPNPWIGAKYVL